MAYSRKKRYFTSAETLTILSLHNVEYIPRLTKPKYVISASGDEFFLPDDHHYWYKNMQGPTMLR